MLASAVDNDGSHSIVVPNITTKQARKKVAGTDHVFFNINAAAIEIQESDYGGERTYNVDIDRNSGSPDWFDSWLQEREEDEQG